jgi:hypothetical protein
MNLFNEYEEERSEKMSQHAKDYELYLLVAPIDDDEFYKEFGSDVDFEDSLN